MKPPTLKDVARAANVSLATAARALRDGKEYVADDTRLRVRSAAQHLHYVPNLMARELKKGSHRSVGLVVGDMRDPYFGEIAQAVSLATHRRSLVGVVANMHRDPQLEIEMCRELWQHRVNGLILAGGGFDHVSHKTELSDLINRLQDMNIVVATLASRDLSAPCFGPDDEAAGRLAAERVVANGHSNIAVIVGPATSVVTDVRLRGMRTALRDTGIEPHLIHTDFGDSAGEDVATQILNIEPRVTAIIASGDRMGVLITQTLLTKGFGVPEDFSLVSIGSTYHSKQFFPQLTAIDTLLAERSAAAVDYIADVLEGGAPQRPQLSPVTFLPGSSLRQVDISAPSNDMAVSL